MSKPSLNRRLVKFLCCFLVLVLFAVVLLNSVTPTELFSGPRPVVVTQRRRSPSLNYRYLLNQAGACRARSPFLVLMVPVAPHEAAARDAVRRTWGSPSPDTLTLFFTGRGRPPPLQEALEEESRQHADLIQVDFMDSYQNLTLKTLMMMQWLVAHCPGASYAMKVDADIFVNVFYLLDRLRSSPKTDFITGSVIWDGRPRRDLGSKWYLSEELYPEDSFPPYVSGAGYVFSTDLADRISWVSRQVPVVPLEDVYVGMCLQVLGVRPVFSRSLPFLRNLFEIQKLEYDRCSFARLVLVNGFRPPELLHIWTDFSKGYASC